MHSQPPVESDCHADTLRRGKFFYRSFSHYRLLRFQGRFFLYSIAARAGWKCVEVLHNFSRGYTTQTVDTDSMLHRQNTIRFYQYFTAILFRMPITYVYPGRANTKGKEQVARQSRLCENIERILYLNSSVEKRILAPGEYQ